VTISWTVDSYSTIFDFCHPGFLKSGNFNGGWSTRAQECINIQYWTNITMLQLTTTNFMSILLQLPLHRLIATYLKKVCFTRAKKKSSRAGQWIRENYVLFCTSIPCREEYLRDKSHLTSISGCTVLHGSRADGYSTGADTTLMGDRSVGCKGDGNHKASHKAQTYFWSFVVDNFDPHASFYCKVATQLIVAASENAARCAAAAYASESSDDRCDMAKACRTQLACSDWSQTTWLT